MSSGGDVHAVVSELPHGCAGVLHLTALTEVPHARRWVRETVERATAFPVTISTHSIDDVELCASEILTNAAQHSILSPEASARVSVVMIGDSDKSDPAVRVECHDPGNTAECLPAAVEAAPYATSGRGWRIVEALATRCGSFVHPDGGTVAWFEIEY
ncbi:ATP-binding protein [Actinomadura adrarensis]|uniref:ATP-binding protein n=1 Tax=Actinomadura adrarensis TaxID=1819600 RepID=A0ABW3CB63_9ACTN